MSKNKLLNILLISTFSILLTFSIGFIIKILFLSSDNNIIFDYKRELSNCSGADSGKCIARYSVNIAKIEGVDRSLDYVKKLIDSRVDLNKGCHSITHYIGNAFYNSFSDDAIIPGHAWCSYGYYHGLMQEHGKLNLDNIIEYATNLCNKAEGFLSDDCMHGIGHATYSNLLSINKALDICNKISKYDFALTCSDGVIMEEFMSSPNGLLTSGFEVIDCLYYNNKAVQAGCGKAMAQQNVNSGLSLDESCNIFSEDIINQCSNGYGSSLAGNIASGSTYKVTANQIKSCNKSDGCAQGFGLIAYNYFRDYNKAVVLCKNNFKNNRVLNNCISSAKLAQDSEVANN